MLANSVLLAVSTKFHQRSFIQNASGLNHKPPLSTQQFLSYSQPLAELDV
jgi:hypothetical protein